MIFMPMQNDNSKKYTGDNLPDEIIAQLREEAMDADDDETASLCSIALCEKRLRSKNVAKMDEVFRARTKLANHLNAVLDMDGRL